MRTLVTLPDRHTIFCTSLPHCTGIARNCEVFSYCPQTRTALQHLLVIVHVNGADFSYDVYCQLKVSYYQLLRDFIIDFLDFYSDLLATHVV